MEIGEGYRWNVPVVTYGFDQSFLDFFGSNGVAAVEGAIAILNDLPPASSMAFTNYPDSTIWDNYRAESQSISDLKSETMSLLLEQLGLANPNRYIYVLRQWNPIFLTLYSDSSWPPGTIPTYIDQMNFDPLTLNPSPFLDGMLYGAVVDSLNNQHSIVPYRANLSAFSQAVASFDYYPGNYFAGLTYDDVGGLAYLLSTNNVNYETLLPDVRGVGRNPRQIVNGAWRPGVDKITFIPQPVDSRSGRFRTTVKYFTDHYLTNGVLHHQQLARIISKPDFLFSAEDVPSTAPTTPPPFTRSGTTNWLNHAAANGNTNGAGPGVIQPQVKIVFNKTGSTFFTYGDIQRVDAQWAFYGSFDGTTNAPIVYPTPQLATNQLTVRMWLATETSSNLSATSFEWKPISATGVPFTFQTSTDLTSWANIFSVTNNGSVCTYLNYNSAAASRFYRLVPQQPSP